MKRTDLDRFFIRNCLSISSSEFLWGLGIPVLLESTFVQIFLAANGASNTVIGFTGTIFSVSISVMPLFAAWFSSGFPRKKNLVVALHIFPSLAVIALGLMYIFTGARFDTVTLFLLFFFLFSFSLGLTLPVWQNFVVKIFSDKKRLQGLSVMMMAQNGTKLAAGVIITWVISFVGLNLTSAGILFLSTGLLFLAGSFGFYFAKEPVDSKPDKELKHPLSYVKHYALHILRNRSARLYILQDIEFYSVLAVFAFYARYAVEKKGVSSSEAAGLFAVCAFTGAVIANLLFGFLWKGHIKGKLYFSKAAAAAGVGLLIVNQGFVSFLAVSFLLGFSRGARFLLYAPALKDISGLEDASPYYAITPLIAVGFASGFPVLAGVTIDVLSSAGYDGYRPVFIVFLLLICVSFVFLRRIEFPNARGDKI